MTYPQGFSSKRKERVSAVCYSGLREVGLPGSIACLCQNRRRRDDNHTTIETNAVLRSAGPRKTALAVGVAVWILVGVDGSKAADQPELVGPQVQEVGQGADSLQERSGLEAIERSRRQIKRMLAVLAAENGTDPTAIIGQLSPRTRYQNRETNQRLQEIFRVNLPLAPNVILRVDAPFTYQIPKDPNDNSVVGWGDLRARLGWRILNSINGSLFIGSEFYFPTASNSQLGSNQYQVGPAVVGSVHLPDLRSTVFLWIEYLTAVTGHGLSTDETSSSESRVRLRVNTVWSKEWWTFIESRLFIDYTQNAKTGMVLFFEGGRRLDSHWRLYVRPGVGLWGRDVPGAFNYGVELGVRYMFYVF